MSVEGIGAETHFPAILVEQPIGRFCVTVLPSKLLLDVCYSERLKIESVDEKQYRPHGSQRALIDERAKEIARYLQLPEATLPNTIILAANYRIDDGEIEEEARIRWRFEPKPECGEDFGNLVIPTLQPLAILVDGQHRLRAFSPEINDVPPMDLVCSVFLDISRPFQAFIFATINSKQKQVPRSLTYELFAYNLDEESPSIWSPDKLAVFLARRLNVESTSPFRKKIIVAAMTDDLPTSMRQKQDEKWLAPMATVVQGILRLITSNVERDIHFIATHANRRRLSLLESGRRDESPLRSEYIGGNDALIYAFVENFFTAARETFFESAKPSSYIFRTVGIQALFDVLRLLLPEALSSKSLSVGYWRTRLAPAAALDFSEAPFVQASGIGRTEIRNAILEYVR